MVITVLSVHELNTEIAKSRGKFFGASERDPIGVRCDLSVNKTDYIGSDAPKKLLLDYSIRKVSGHIIRIFTPRLLLLKTK